MKHSMIAAITLILLACGVSSDTGINKSIFVADGEHRDNGLRSVNGSITVGNQATINGSCSTVNGKITVGEQAEVGEVSCVNGRIFLDRGSKTEEISCVNGSITLASEVEVNGNVKTVNGAITSKTYTHIGGDMETVNGHIETKQTTIGGDVKTVNGDIDLMDQSLIKGMIFVNRDTKKKWPKQYKELVITIASGSKVNGNIEVKGEDPNVTVIITGGGEVLGEIINARVVRK